MEPQSPAELRAGRDTAKLGRGVFHSAPGPPVLLHQTRGRARALDLRSPLEAGGLRPAAGRVPRACTPLSARILLSAALCQGYKTRQASVSGCTGLTNGSSLEEGGAGTVT
jgi:hypothetical protein